MLLPGKTSEQQNNQEVMMTMVVIGLLLDFPGLA